MLAKRTAARRRRRLQGSPKCEECLRWRGLLRPSVNQSASWVLALAFGFPKRLVGPVKDSRCSDVVEGAICRFQLS